MKCHGCGRRTDGTRIKENGSAVWDDYENLCCECMIEAIDKGVGIQPGGFSPLTASDRIARLERRLHELAGALYGYHVMIELAGTGRPPELERVLSACYDIASVSRNPAPTAPKG